MLIKSDIISDIGCVRARNEDMILFAGEYFRDKSDMQIFELSDTARFGAIVADGIGGHNGGNIASEMALRQFEDLLLELPTNLSENDITETLKQWAERTHRLILDTGFDQPEYEGMGTTFCGLFFYRDMVFALNIGDSRLYRFRGGILKQLSTDHSIRQLTGILSQSSNQIYNSLGAGKTTFIDIKTISGQLLDDDLYLICSDGLSDMISDQEIENILIETPSAESLVTAAKKAGGKDNVSVILLRIVN